MRQTFTDGDTGLRVITVTGRTTTMSATDGSDCCSSRHCYSPLLDNSEKQQCVVNNVNDIVVNDNNNFDVDNVKFDNNNKDNEIKF